MPPVRRLLLPAVLAAATLAGAAAASGFGGLSAGRLNGFAGSGGSGAPTVHGSDHFNGANLSNLHGRALVIGGTWTVAGGVWSLSANQAESAGATLGRVVAPTGQANVRVVATVSDTSSARRSGLVVRSNDAGSTYLHAYTRVNSGNRIYLAKRSGGSSTVLANVSGLTYTSPATFAVEASGTTVKVLYNGVVHLTHTLSASDQTTFGALGAHGLLNDNSASIVRFDDFRVESLSP